MTLGGAVVVKLPAGMTSGGVRHREAVLQALTGREEELLTALEEEPRAARVTAVLAACVARLGPDRPGPDGVRALTIGDREALLLCLRRLTLGGPLDCLLTCPAAGCGERLDVRLETADLLLPPYEDPRDWYEEAFEGDGQRVRVRFRLPTGGDQEAVAALAAADPVAAAAHILQRCVERVVAPDGDSPAELGTAAAAAVAHRMAELDPQAELRLDVLCPCCGGHVDAVLDAAAFLFDELSAPARSLYDEVHTLASWYHWGEGEILGLTAPKRRRYLDLIAARAAAQPAWRSA